MFHFQVNPDAQLSFVQQIAEAITIAIANGELKPRQRLLSINEFSRKFHVSRDTVEKAYVQLKQAGKITSVSGKGYFVLDKQEDLLSVLFIFDKQSTPEKSIWNTLMTRLTIKAVIVGELCCYPKLLKEQLNIQKGCFDFYMIPAGFFHDASELDCCLRLIKMIQEQ